MKKLNLLLFALLSTLIFSCEKVDDLKTIEFDTNVEHTASIVINTVSGNVEPTTAFDINEEIKLEDNGDFSQYADDRIAGITLKKITLLFSNFNGETTGEIEGDISFTGIAGISANLSRFNVKEASDNQTAIEIPLTEGELTQIAEALKNNQMLGIVFAGTAYDAPMSFDMDYDVEVGASIEIL